MTHLLNDIIGCIERKIPLNHQETYDNSGLLIGDSQQKITGVLCTLDVTLSVLQEAKEQACNLVVAHHPLIFQPIKKITPDTVVGKCIQYAIQQNIAIYALHTNLDNNPKGVNYAIGRKLGLQNLEILYPQESKEMLLTFFAPVQEAKAIRQALHGVEGGSISPYGHCSFTTMETGRFMSSKQAMSYRGEKERLAQINEERIEMIIPSHLQSKIVKMLYKVHPYQTPVYYLQPLSSSLQPVGSGMVGTFSKPFSESEFLVHLAKTFSLTNFRYTSFNRPIYKVALCGGAGAYLLPHAIAQQADAFISADVRYHTFFEAQNNILLADIGHYESEVIAIAVMQELLQEAYPGFPVFRTEINTNPIDCYNAYSNYLD